MWRLADLMYCRSSRSSTTSCRNPLSYSLTGSGELGAWIGEARLSLWLRQKIRWPGKRFSETLAAACSCDPGHRRACHYQSLRSKSAALFTLALTVPRKYGGRSSLNQRAAKSRTQLSKRQENKIRDQVSYQWQVSHRTTLSRRARASAMVVFRERACSSRT